MMEIDINKHRKNLQLLALVIIALISCLRAMIWILPSPLMGVISEDLDLTLSQGGMLMYIVTILMGAFLFFGSICVDRLGSWRAMALSIFCFIVDGVTAWFATSYWVLMIGRVMSGVGYGLNTCALGVLVAERFPPEKRLLANGFCAAMNSVGVMLAYAVTIPLYDIMGESWRKLLLTWSASALVLGIVYTLMESRLEKKGPQKEANPVKEKAKGKTGNSSLVVALRYRETRWTIFAMFGGMWLYTCFNTYLPTVLPELAGIDTATASTVASLISAGGLISCLCCAFLKGKCPAKGLMIGFCVLMCAGAFMSILLPMPALQVGVFFTGFGFTAWATVIATVLMGTPGFTPEVYGAANALYYGTGSLFTILVPSVFEALAGGVGMKTTMLIFSALAIIPILGMAMYPNRDDLKV